MMVAGAAPQASGKSEKRRGIRALSLLWRQCLTSLARRVDGRISLAERTPAGHSVWRSECGARGRRLVTGALGRLGHHPAGTRTGARGASLDWDRRGAGNARGEAQGLRPPVGAAVQDRTLRLSLRKHGLCCALGMNSPLGESRGGTPTGVRALQGARRTERCGTCKLASAGVPLPFFLFFLGLPGIDRDGAGHHRRLI